MKSIYASLFASVLMSISLGAQARELAGVTLPDTDTVAGKTLQLNGLGIRQATFLKVNVYVAGLYVEKPSHDATALLDAAGPKKLVMKFVRSVGADKLKGAWDESLENNCDKDCAEPKAGYEKLKSFMVDMKDGDVMALTFLPAEVQVDVQGKRAGVIPGARFSKVLLTTWLGAHPPNEGLKEGLLGSK